MATQWRDIKYIASAELLRRFADISRIRDEKRKHASSDEGEDSFEKQKALFIQSTFLESEFEALEVKIVSAAKQGKYDVEVMKFPAAYCTDGGRAINNFEKGWPETLQGKAKSFFDIWKEYGQPKGYALKVKIVDYPGGFIGNVSLSIDWS